MSSAKHSRREPADLAAARAVAQREVAKRYPAFAGVEPTVTPRRHTPPSEVLGRVGLKRSQVVFNSEQPSAEYTFTFRAETHTADGHATPCVARVTVDAKQRVVKTTLSK
jgi:hypothetical protein